MTVLGGHNKFIADGGSGEAKANSEQIQTSIYASHKKIYPKEAHGTFRNIKWAVTAITLGLYYILPWIRWDRGPGLPNQAFLLDFANQRLLFGPIEIWAQEFYYVTGALVLSALMLFLVTAIAGRMWCGYACPQTVWTDLMIAVERFWQGDRRSYPPVWRGRGSCNERGVSRSCVARAGSRPCRRGRAGSTAGPGGPGRGGRLRSSRSAGCGS